MGTFGKRSKDRPAPGGDLFLKTFKEPRTLVWFLEDDPNNWVEFKQHFDKKEKRGFPCAKHEGAKNCVGCEFPVTDPTDEKDHGFTVRDRSGRWVVPVLDEKGYVSLYMIGYRLWKQLCEQYDEYGSVIDRRWAIRRSGSGFNDIAYTATRTDEKVSERPEIKRQPPGEDYISQLLGKQYTEAMDRYDYTPDDSEPVDPDPVEAERSGDPASEALAAAKTKAKAEKVSADEHREKNGADEGQTGLFDGADGRKLTREDAEFNAREASIGELKDWLDRQDPKIEYPARAGRPTLVSLVEKAQVPF